MDPTATCKFILSAIAAGDLETAEDYLGDLRAWFARGGFKPAPALLEQVRSAATLARLKGV